MAVLRNTLAFLLLALTLPGCTPLTEGQRTMLVRGEQAFRNKDYDGAARQLSSFLAEAKDQPEAARARYVRGMAFALTGHRAQAYSDLRQAARTSVDRQLAWQPAVALGILYFEDEDWSAAAQLFAAAATRMPAAPPMDAVLFRTGLCYERMGRWTAALAPYRRIAGQFSNGPYAANAERRLQLRADHFAIQCGVYSRSDNADHMVAKLQQSGLRPHISQEQRGGTLCHVVLEGRYGTYPEAIQALARVRGYVPEAVLWP